MRYLVLALTACVHLAHVDPRLRDPFEQHLASVELTIECSEPDPFTSFNIRDLTVPTSPDVVWLPTRRASGVIISERHILTAYHAVACPVLPTIRGTLANGHHVRLVVTREDPNSDIARLELLTADTFDLGVAPPSLAVDDFAVGSRNRVDEWCAVTLNDAICGDVLGFGTFAGATRFGHSGAGVYNEYHRLVGLVSAGNGVATRIAFVDASWLSGT